MLRVVCVEAAIKFDTGRDGIKRLVSGRFEQLTGSRVFFLRVVFSWKKEVDAFESLRNFVLENLKQVLRWDNENWGVGNN